MTDLPRGTVTFLFSDIEGSTALWERDAATMAAAVDRHLELLRGAIESHRGSLFKVVGDAVQAAFPTAPDAVAAALDAQRALVQEPWADALGALPVRVALHTAAAEPRDGDYLAPGLNRLARLLTAAHGGQVLLSLATQDLARDALPTGASLRDLGEHPLRDLFRPERVFQLLHADVRADFPPLRTLATRPNNLPVQPTPFVGREAEVAGIGELLRRDDVRLLTITGPGGVGKTRLSLQAAADLLEHYADGVWFVDLSALTESGLVTGAIASAVGVREEGEPRGERLARALGEKQLLLVLDNFERVVDAAPEVAALLTRAPAMDALVTSRVPLHVYGEREFPLAPLPLPDPARLPPIERLSQFEAVRLFLARAQAVQPGFAVTNENAPAVAEICSRLDGLPLAIELAAARVKVLPPRALLKRLERRLPLLTGGARNLPARQQTMRDAIAWSYDLLRPDEQAVFRRLTVFPGGCTLEAAEAVAGAEGAVDVLAAVAALVDNSLLRQIEDAAGEPRFRMLETVREYGLEQLEAHGEAGEAKRKLASWCLALVETAGPELAAGREFTAWLRRLDEELPNLRAAVAWFLETGAEPIALRFLTVSHEYWNYRWHHAEVHHWLNRALAAAPPTLATERALAYHMLAMADSMLGDQDAAARQAQLSLAAAQEAGDPFVLGLTHFSVGLVAEFSGDGEGAAASYAVAVPLLRQSGNTFFTAWVLAELGDKLVRSGDLTEAVKVLDEALALNRQGGHETGVAQALGQRGLAALAQGDLPLGASLLVESLDAAEAIDDQRVLLGAIAGMAGIALALDQPARAARLLGAVEVAKEEARLDRVAHGLHVATFRERASGALGADAFTAEWTAGRAMTRDAAEADARAIANLVVSQHHDRQSGASIA